MLHISKHFLWKFVWEILLSKVALQNRGVDIDRCCCVYVIRMRNPIIIYFLNVTGVHKFGQKALRTVLQLHCGAYGTTETVAPFSIDVQNMTLRFIGSQNTSRNTQSAAEVGNKIRQLENRVSPVVWQPPQGDIIKINTDAAVPQNQNTISLGVVIRSSESKVLGAAQINCTFKGSVLQAEVMEIDFALQLGKEFGCKRVEIEYDSA
ncbi:hypothetical protein SLEP1_g59312 [Rubroshorea leprosula]|uniref:RNase H type-1 domain-containing protein n=1 Tax=Rubroshorea leprosula TaxID=152421 RepID=A0AAV5MUF6_9ROSI|nr:hypothetical protein SLEP1_g59312 [Rubroshorea leprosula]